MQHSLLFQKAYMLHEIIVDEIYIPVSLITQVFQSLSGEID